MLRLKLQYFGCLMQRANSLEKSLMLRRLKAGGKENNRGWDDWMTLPTQWTWVWASSRKWWRTGKPGVLQSIGFQRVGHNWVTEQQVSLWRAPSLWPAQLLSCVWLLATPRTIAQHAPLSMRFSRQEYWIGLPFLSPGDLPNPGIKPASPSSYDLVTPKSPAPNNLTLDAEFQFVNSGGVRTQTFRLQQGDGHEGEICWSEHPPPLCGVEERQLLNRKGADPRKDRERMLCRQMWQVLRASHPLLILVSDSIYMEYLEEADV